MDKSHYTENYLSIIFLIQNIFSFKKHWDSIAQDTETVWVLENIGFS